MLAPAILAYPTEDVIAVIRLHAPLGVVEIGAGNGHWGEVLQRAGIPWVGYDIKPRGPLVAFGDHLTASRHAALACLIVWPPDQTDLSEWLAPWRTAFVCGDFSRFGKFSSFAPIAGFRELESLVIPRGRKGESILKVLSHA